MPAALAGIDETEYRKSSGVNVNCYPATITGQLYGSGRNLQGNRKHLPDVDIAMVNEFARFCKLWG
jgi:hypothetical protein